MKKRLWITTGIASTSVVATCLVGASAPAFAGEGHGHGGGSVAQEQRGGGDRQGGHDRGDRGQRGADRQGTKGDGQDGDRQGRDGRDCDKDGQPDPAAVPEEPVVTEPETTEPVATDPVAPAPEPVPAREPAPEPVSAVDAAEVTILGAANELRAAEGTAALERNAAIDAVAQAWAEHLAATGVLAHNPQYAAQIPAGWTAAGENVAVNSYDPAALATQWASSPLHRANIVNPAFTQVGIAVVEQDGHYYGVQVFAGY